MARKPLFRPADHDLTGRFKAAHFGLPVYWVHTTDSLYTYKDMADVLAVIGLASKPKGRIVLTPEKAPIQWGWATDNRRQIAFEIGTPKTLVSLHFRKVSPAFPATPWHLDTTEMDMGHKDALGRPVTFHMPCDEAQYSDEMDNLLRLVRGTTTLMQKGDLDGARDNLDDLIEPIVRRLDVVSEVAAADHEEAFLYKHGLVDPGQLRL